MADPIITDVLAGETYDNKTVIEANTVNVYGTAITNTIEGTMHVYEGGTASDNTVQNGGMMRISGGLADATILENGGAQVLVAGTATNTTINQGALVRVYTGASAVELVENGGKVIVDNGAVATFVDHTFTGLTINSDEIATVHKNTVAYGNTVNGGTLEVFDGGVANNNILKAGAIRLSAGAIANNNTVNGSGFYVCNGGVANYTTAIGADGKEGKLYVYEGGLLNSTTLGEKGSAFVYNGGTATNTEVNAGAVLYLVNAYGTGAPIASDTIVKGGELQIQNTGNAVNTVVEAGSIIVLAGGTATNLNLAAGATLTVRTGATLDGTTFSNRSLYVESGTIVRNTTVNGGGELNVNNNNFSGDKKYAVDGVTVTGESADKLAKAKAYFGGIINDLTINNFGRAFIYQSVVNNATVNEGGELSLVVASWWGTEAPQANSTTVNGGIFNVVGTGQAFDTVVNAGTVTIAAGATVTNLTLLKDGVAEVNAAVEGGTIGGTVKLAADVPLNDVTFAAGADIQCKGMSWLKVSNTNPATKAFEGAVDFSYVTAGDTMYCAMEGSGDLFFNGNTVSMDYVALNLGTNSNLYGGMNLAITGEEGDKGNYAVGGDATINAIGGTVNQIFNGGKITGAFGGTITGDTSMAISGLSANRIYAGYEVDEASGSTATVKGDSLLDVTGGTTSYIRGGVLKGNGGAMVVEGNASTKVTNTVVSSVVGDYQVGAGAAFTRTGDVDVTVSGTAYITGTLAGAGVSFGGAYTLNGSVSTTIEGGYVLGNVFGGVSVGSTGAVAISENCTITGDVNVTIDCSVNKVTIGKSSNTVTSIFVGSYAKGTVGGNATLTLKGDASKLKLASVAEGYVEFIGDSSLATNKKGYVTRSSALVFDGFSCGTTSLNVQNIAGFDTIEFKNGSNVQIGFLDTLKDVSTWKFDAADGQTLFTVEAVDVTNDFANANIDITFENTLTNCTLMDMKNSEDWFSGIDSAIVKFNGTEAVWNGSNAFVADGFSLSVDTTNKALVLSKLALA